ncbi:probable G-protein coupled receptor 141 [Sinocyclocheilus anshuiensis]|uniref:probable G-protein coupled receptor 141 n=1 Tax=Sinocyclocheilus anshuiensis TaxID=1608454 RepID=UPI0007BAB9B1|nr:PREDICTED: probable G-protein coupled receptor 141 [Sinocyclocheilus anshuiensis]XP_016313515.1 PREDICTED: probable G-protein coupled receptor 141 [Sinocyclocheilus anshuiensis]
MAMNTTVDNITSPAVTTNPTSEAPSDQAHLTEPFRVALIIIYTAVLLVGITGLTVMISLLKTNIRSLTTIAFLNLMVAHFLFLLTVPFRIYYYVSQTWQLGQGFCKLVSAMVHIHIYMVFTIYSILLTIRFLHFYKKTQRTEFYRRLHGLGASALVWFILLIIILPVVLKQYGQKTISLPENQCFKFGDEIHNYVYALNMVLSIFIITVSCLQTCIQVIILRSMILKYGPASRSQQEFWVQIKNLSFVLIMLTCLVPYHLFRLQYLNNIDGLHQINEVFLAITGLTCFDMLTFTGKNIYKVCWTG